METTIEYFNVDKHTCREFNVLECKRLIYLKPYIPMSWAARQFTNDRNKVLGFRVSGHLHKGWVIVTLNGSDLYDFYLTDLKFKIKYTEKDIYFEDLVERIDTKVEKIAKYVR